MSGSFKMAFGGFGHLLPSREKVAAKRPNEGPRGVGRAFSEAAQPDGPTRPLIRRLRRHLLPRGEKEFRGAACLLLALVVAAPASARPIELRDYLSWQFAGGAQISPDGKRIVYRLTTNDPKTDSDSGELWIMDGDGGKPRPFLKGGGQKWSPDGGRLAYTASQDKASQIFVRDMTKADGAAKAITAGSLSPGGLAWSADGKWIAFVGRVPSEPDDLRIKLPAKPEGAKWADDATVIGDLNYRGMTGGLRTSWRHVFVVPAEGGEARQLTSGEWDIGARFSGMSQGGTLNWTPDGKGLVFDGLLRPDSYADRRFSDINLLDVATKATRKLNPRPGFWTNPAVSPDGKWVAYSGYGDDDGTWPKRELHVVGVDGAGDRILVDDLPDDPSSIAWAADGRGVYYAVNARGETNLRYVSLKGEDRALSKGRQRLFVGSYGRDAAVATQETTTSGYNIARIDLKTGEVKRLTDANAEVLKSVELASTEPFELTAKDGQRLQGWIVKPADFDPARKYPMILEIHGGPHSLYGEGFDFRFQDFAAHGYVVLYMNPRGSTGYGSKFAAAIDQAFPGNVDSDDLLAGVDAAVAKGFVDPDRLFVMGCSGGGSLTAWLTAKTKRFKAAAVLCPVSDWISQAGTTDVAAWGYSRFAKPFWEDPGPWLAHSPVMQVGKVETPTLVMVGDKDFRTPVGQAEQYYSALKLRGVPSKLVILKGETHQPWKSLPSNMIRSQLYLRTWFGRYGGTKVEDNTAPAP